MADFVQLCLMDQDLGDAILKIFRAVISKSFILLLRIVLKVKLKKEIQLYLEKNFSTRIYI